VSDDADDEGGDDEKTRMLRLCEKAKALLLPQRVRSSRPAAVVVAISVMRHIFRI